MPRDQYAYVIEYLPNGLAESRERRPSAVILTESTALLIAALKKGIEVSAGQKVYIGENKRDEVHHIIGRVSPEKLSDLGLQTLSDKVKESLNQNEKKYISIINVLGPVNVRLHSLELIPGLGKKTVQKLVEERNKKPFESYKDVDSRVGLVPGIEKDIEQRIMDELSNKDKYKIFTG
ncbi:DUF655 domain-containing protein [Candidatus Parvarchaeota archaeon]|nr:DUF655 domain-containing protein [Candidatus Parvarchaeota archaeon]